MGVPPLQRASAAAVMQAEVMARVYPKVAANKQDHHTVGSARERRKQMEIQALAEMHRAREAPMGIEEPLLPGTDAAGMVASDVVASPMGGQQQQREVRATRPVQQLEKELTRLEDGLQVICGRRVADCETVA